MDQAVIASACRTPVGSLSGSLSGLTAPQLGAVVIREAVKRAGLKPEDVNEVIFGNVLSAGLGQAPARQAAIFAGLPVSVECLTINKMCGSGLKSVGLAAQAVALGDADVVVAGGMESMSNAPYLLDGARRGYRMGHAQVIDSMIKDGLWDVYNNFHVGSAAELCARECAIPREAQDTFAVESYRRALEAQKSGAFTDEIVPVATPQRKGEPVMISADEEPGKVDLSRVSSLKTAFEKDGTVTAANASKISDGAAAVVVMAAERAAARGVRPLARIVAQASAAKRPEYFTTAPVDAVEKVLRKANLTIADIDLFEINEAFAVVALVALNQLGIDPAKLNVHGGAVALGHPIGASGARILTTLLYAMKQRNARLGLAALCIGGGEATAMIVERV